MSDDEELPVRVDHRVPPGTAFFINGEKIVGSITNLGRVELSDNDITNLEKIAQLRGHLGKLRAQIVMARDILLRYEHRAPKPDYPVQALTILSQALEIPAP